MGLSIDESRFPVVVLDVRDRMTEDDIRGVLAAGERWLARTQPYAIVVVAQQTGIPAISTLKPAFHWMKEHEDELERWHCAFALVTDSAVVRGAMRAVLILRPMSAHQLVTASRNEAIAWAESIVGRERSTG